MFSRKNIIISIATICFVSFTFGLYIYNKNCKLSAASYALEVTLSALNDRDLETFQTHVNTRKLAESILAQVFEESSEEEAKDDSFWGTVKNLGNSLSSRLTGYIKPELANSLDNQIITYVKNGKFTESYDLTNLYGSTPMLQKIWYDLAGESFTFKGFSDTIENENTAITSAIFYRKDLDFSSSLILKLNKIDEIWQIVAIEGLGQTLKQLDNLRIKLVDSKNKEILNRINNSLLVKSIEKSTGVSQAEFASKRVLLRIAFENIGETDIKSFHATITFKDKDGGILRTVSIKDSDVILSEDIAEKSWPMSINPLSSNDNQIFKAKTGDLIIESHINSLTLATGEKLELIKLEK